MGDTGVLPDGTYRVRQRIHHVVIVPGEDDPRELCISTWFELVDVDTGVVIDSLVDDQVRDVSGMLEFLRHAFNRNGGILTGVYGGEGGEPHQRLA